MKGEQIFDNYRAERGIPQSNWGKRDKATHLHFPRLSQNLYSGHTPVLKGTCRHLVLVKYDGYGSFPVTELSENGLKRSRDLIFFFF